MFRAILRKAPRPKPEKDDLIQKWKVVRGDTVEIIAGKDRGRKGLVTKVMRDRNKVIVEGLNLVKKHVKSTEQAKGGIVSKESPIHVSNVSLLDPVSGKPTRVRWGFLAEGQRNMGEMNEKGRVRIAKKSGAIIPKPALMSERKKTKPQDGPKDTVEADVHMQTYHPPVVEATVLNSIEATRKKEWKYIRQVLKLRSKENRQVKVAARAEKANLAAAAESSTASSAESSA